MQVNMLFFTLLKNRQEDCSTVISPFVAIPHIKAEEKNRNRGGGYRV